MASFCGTCGSPLGETSTFCGACGAKVEPQETPLAAAPVPTYQPVTPLPQARTGMSPVIKIVLVVVVLLVLVGTVALAGLYYVFHLAARKAHQISEQVRNSAIVASLPRDEDASPAIAGPGDCRLLSKEDVGRAIGIAIVSTRTTADGCEYLAQGTAGDLRSKHIAAMMASNGADPHQNQMMQSLSKGLFGGGQQADGSTPNADVNSVVLAFTIAVNTSESPLSGTRMPGIGEEASVTAGSVMMVRKRDKLIRITYSTCPCTTAAIVPLAKRLAASQ